MEVNEEFVVYELNNVMGSEKHKALEKISFNTGKRNGFESEGEAIKALVDDKRHDEPYVILKQIYIH